MFHILPSRSWIDRIGRGDSDTVLSESFGQSTALHCYVVVRSRLHCRVPYAFLSHLCCLMIERRDRPLADPNPLILTHLIRLQKLWTKDFVASDQISNHSWHFGLSLLRLLGRISKSIVTVVHCSRCIVMSAQAGDSLYGAS